MNSSKTKSDNSKPVQIQPVEPRLTSDPTRRRSGSRFRVSARFVQGLAVFTFVACAIAIFVWVPQRDPLPITNGETRVPDESVSSQSGTETQETPFLDAQHDRAMEQAEETLNDFSSLQDHYESHQLGSEKHLALYNDAIDRANNGDILFGRREFAEAQKEFETALEELRQLIATIDTEFEEWMTAGLRALDERDVTKSRSAFVHAAEIKPLEQSPHEALQRVEKLPKINELLRESDRASLRGNWDEALSFLDQAETLDDLTQEIDSRRESILSARAGEELNHLLSLGHQALNQDDFDEADRLFNEVLRRHPDNAAAETGLQKSQVSRTVAQISDLQATALQQENELKLTAAMQTFEQALEIDSTLEFAIEGRDRVREIVTLSAQISTVLNDPGNLSGDQELELARQVLEDAQKYINHSDAYDEALNELAEIVEIASQFVPVVLISDNATEVTLSTKGQLGSFERHEIQLRPGRYQLIGSRDGREDVRKTFNVEPDMDPVSIICENEI
ncbi:MAG: tetratricopeptide repeat protein [Gammaproteobacteria bacterium]|nr:tetratricopeptide repeat protein [Gammaproteobacteria bacterium]